MKVYSTLGDNKITISIEGSVDTTTSSELHSELSKLNIEEMKEVEIDFSKTHYISSAGLRELLIFQKRFNQGKIKVKNEFGKIETVEVDKGVIEDIALAFRDTGIEAGEKIYDIQDLRQHVRNDLVLTSIESQLNVGNRARSKQETNAIEQREEDIRSGKTAEVFRNNLRNRRR